METEFRRATRSSTESTVARPPAKAAPLGTAHNAALCAVARWAPLAPAFT